MCDLIIKADNYTDVYYFKKMNMAGEIFEEA